jgi:hypothetical protein
MDLGKVLAELRQELADLDAAIASLEQFQLDRPPRRGHATKGQVETSRDATAAASAAAETNGRNRDTA